MNMMNNKESGQVVTDGCIIFDRIYDIACDTNIITEDEKKHLRSCEYCRKNLELALLFQDAMNAEAMLKDENDEPKKNDLQFPGHNPYAKDEQYDGLLLAGAPERELTKFDMTYEASNINRQNEDYWKAVLTVRLGKEYNIVGKEELIEQVQIDFNVSSGSNSPLSGTLKIFNKDITIVNGSSDRKEEISKDDFMGWVLNPSEEGDCFFQREDSTKLIPGELFL